MQRVKQGRINDQTLQVSDLFAISYMRYSDGSFPFVKLRHDVSGSQVTRTSSEDPVLAPLLRLGEVAFPFTLLPNPIDQVMPLRGGFPNFLRTPDAVAFENAVMEDKVLARLFPARGSGNLSASDRFNVVANIFTSNGSFGSLQLVGFAGILLESASDLVCLRGNETLDSYLEALKDLIELVRVVASGGIGSIPMILIFDGVGLPPGVEIKLRSGILKSLPASCRRIVPPAARPAVSEGGTTGIMLMLNIDYEIKFGLADFDDIRPSWSAKIRQNDITQHIEDVSLITSLALGGECPVAARYTAWVSVDPFRPGSAVAWRDRTASARQLLMATDEECLKLTEWAAIVGSVANGMTNLAVRRYLSAITERADLSDSLVDAVIGLENLFSSRNDIGFSIATCVARLLGATSTERQKIFAEIKKVYGARSTIVHGGKQQRAGDLLMLRNLAVSYLCRCLRRLYADFPQLLSLSSDERVKLIALMD